MTAEVLINAGAGEIRIADLCLGRLQDFRVERIIGDEDGARHCHSHIGDIVLGRVQRVLAGMIFTFPGDCFPDASAIMMTMFELLPHETGAWLQNTLQMLPPGSMKPAEAERLLKSIAEKVQSGEIRKIRILLQGK